MEIKSYLVLAALVFSIISSCMAIPSYAQSGWVTAQLEDARSASLIENNRYDSAVDDENLLESGEMYAASGQGTSDSTYIEAPSKKWQFSIIPYLWLMGINGKTTIKGRTADLNVSFGDIWDNLDFAAEVHLEAWRGRYGFFIDTSYAKIALKKDVDLRFDNTLNTKFITKFFLGEIGGFYRVGTWPVGGGYEKKTNTSFTFDVIGGGRYWYLKNTLKLNGPLGILPPEISDSQNWFDFFVGGRAKLAINKFFINVRSDLGGFGLGFSSDISWNIAGYIGYELPWYRITPIIGYRALYDKYKNGSGDNRFVWDAWISGPQVGVEFKF
jgi:hypothetical protein